ncbi:uncharacterized protein LOC134289797 [Aedes albopictus]|uniref:Peptidase S1 domain-containing protein n=1 Tax=Aedes albopictus TaxID=7160 RepID=A0ABM2A5M6_AEDAL
MSLDRKFLLWITLTSIVVWTAVPDGESIRKASFVYRKISGSIDSTECSANYTCRLQKEFCAAFHLGEGIYVTTAHCLLTGNRTIAKVDRLDIVGVGLANVTLTLHKNFSLSDGVDIAWIAVHDLNLTTDVLEIANTIPEKCIRYQLELFDTSSKDIQAGFHWVQQLETIHPNSSNLKPFRHGMLAFQFSEELDRSELEHVIMCTTKEHPNDFKLQFIAYGRAGRFSFDTDCYRAECGAYQPEIKQLLQQVNVSLPDEKQKMSNNSNESSHDERTFGLRMAEISGLVTVALDDIEKPHTDTFSNAIEDLIEKSNFLEAQGDFPAMNVSVLSDAFEGSSIIESIENDSHRAQLPGRSTFEDNMKDTKSLPGYFKNINESLSNPLYGEDGMEPAVQASNLNALYSVPSNQIHSPLTHIAASEYFADNFEKSPTKKIQHQKLDQNWERCENPTTTSTCPLFLLEPSPPVTTETSTSTGVVCSTTHQEVAPTTNHTFNSSATAEEEMERRRQKALRKILIHLVRSRSEAAPNVMAGSTGFVLVAMGFVILMMVI